MFAHVEDIDKWYPIRASESAQVREGTSYYPLLDYSDETKICSTSSDTKVPILFLCAPPFPPFLTYFSSPNSKKLKKKLRKSQKNPVDTLTSPPSTQSSSFKPIVSFTSALSEPSTTTSVFFAQFKQSNRGRKPLLLGRQEPKDKQGSGSKGNCRGL